MITHLKVAGILAVGVLGCRPTEFRGKNGEKVIEPAPAVKPPAEAPKPIEHEVAFTCRDVSNGVLATRVDFRKGDTLRVSGQFCPEADLKIDEKTILFLVDFSGSMRVNDPLVNGQCKRYQAIQSAVAKIAASPNADRFIKVGIIGFETDSKKILNLTIPSAAQNSLKASDVCVYGGSTNYQDAFNEGFEMLSDVQGSKDIYFVSDGLPTVSSFDSAAKKRVENDSYRISSVEIENLGFQKNAPGTLAAENGLAAARYLRSQVDETSIIAFFLEGGASSTVIGTPVANPTRYLAAITGNPLNVKLVDSAAQLVTEISDFANVPVESLSVMKPTLTIDYGNNLKEKVRALTFEQLKDSQFSYSSAPFEPSKKRGEYSISWRVEDNRNRESLLVIDLEVSWKE